MAERRLVGIDLGIATAHTVRVLREDGSQVCRQRCWPRLDSLEEVERVALGDSEDVRLEVVIEPTGPAWLPVAVFFTSRGHTVYRVSSSKAAALRRFLSRHAKSNGIDAETLARLPLVDPGGLQPLQPPEGARASLDRRVRVCNRLTHQAGEQKTRIKDLVRQLLPETPLGGELRKGDLVVLERTGADPRRLLAMGKARLSRMIAKASVGHLDGERRAEAWLDAARSALELYGDHPTLAYEDRAAEITTEVQLLGAIEAELSKHEAAREAAYLQVDVGQLARSCPAWPRSAGPPRCPGWAKSSALPVPPRSAPSPAWLPGPRRPARATARASRCPRQDPETSARRSCGPPTTLARSILSWPASTTSRWWSGVPTT